VSFTGSFIFVDEWEQHPFAGPNFTQAKPVIDAGGQYVGCFTVDKTKPDTLAKTVWREAFNDNTEMHPYCEGVPGMIYPTKPGPNGFVPIFFPYHVRPGRTEEWYERTKRETPAESLDNLTPDLYMTQNYPRTYSEALSPTQSLAAVDLNILEQMKPRCMGAIQVMGDGIDPKICNIYQDFAVGKIYLAATDTSHGVGKDYNVTVIMNARTGAIVADIFNNFMEPDDLAWHSVKLLSHFRNPIWWIEDNECGGTTISKARELLYPNFGYQDAKRTREGWHTHSSNRTTLFGNMVAAFNSSQITIFNYKGLLQFGDLIRNMDANGRIEAMKGRCDDYPVAVAICVAKNAEVLKQGTYNPNPIQTLHFEPNRLVRSGR
jgi:hypothetical protein